jgi:carboxymethylenebutenolidase
MAKDLVNHKEAKMDISTTTVKIDTADGAMEAYEARPSASGSHPAVIVLMEAFGVNKHIKEVTDRVAREGYVAVAPDLYHRQPERVVPYQDMQKAIGLMKTLEDPKVMDDVGAVLSYLKSQPHLKPGAIGIMGFCMGGRYAYLSAAHHSRDLKAAVSFYGGGIPNGNPSPLDRTAQIGCPIQLFFGDKDQLIPAEHVEKIKSALDASGKDFDLKVYAGAGHGFFCDDRQSHHPEAAKDAWEKTKTLFARHLA